jgi:hypothetical protein
MSEEMKRYFDLDEKRGEARVYQSGEMFIEVVSAEPGENDLPEIARCEVVDISANGAQLLVCEELRIGAIHTLIVDLDQHHDNYRLTAEVRWVKPCKDDFLTGVVFYASEQTHIIDWKLLMARFLN